MKTVYIDIETIPGQATWIGEYISRNVKPPGNIKLEASKEKWWKEKGDAAIEQAMHKCGLDATMGEVICICWAVDDGDVKAMAQPFEHDTLKFFWTEMLVELDRKYGGGNHAPTFCGHNVSFDLGFIWRRCVINGLNPAIKIPYAEPPWSDKIIDTCDMWKGQDKATSGSLDMVCRAMGIGGKEGMNGSDVWQYWKDGRIEEIAEYCKLDVIKCRLIHQRMMFRGQTDNLELDL